MSATVRASRTSSSADWSRATVRVSFRENHWRGLADHRTVAALLFAATPSRPCYLHHSVGPHYRTWRRQLQLDCWVRPARGDHCIVGKLPWRHGSQASLWVMSHLSVVLRDPIWFRYRAFYLGLRLSPTG